MPTCTRATRDRRWRPASQPEWPAPSPPVPASRRARSTSAPCRARSAASASISTCCGGSGRPRRPWRSDGQPMRIRPEVDVLVCGGGTAGAVAAVAAARTGARTLLVEQYGSVGGMASTGMSFLGVSDGSGQRALGCIGAELLDRLAATGAAFEDRPDSQVGSVSVADPVALQQALLEMLLDAGVTFLLHTFCVDA